LAHKVLGNQEFCMQIDAHMEFTKNWDEKVKTEWANTGNEFGIISTIPAGLGEKEEVAVPRQCAVDFQDIGIPVRNVLDGLERKDYWIPTILSLCGSLSHSNIFLYFLHHIRHSKLEGMARWKT
jgi:hypothetical protein